MITVLNIDGLHLLFQRLMKFYAKCLIAKRRSEYENNKNIIDLLLSKFDCNRVFDFRYVLDKRNKIFDCSICGNISYRGWFYNCNLSVKIIVEKIFSMN